MLRFFLLWISLFLTCGLSFAEISKHVEFNDEKELISIQEQESILSKFAVSGFATITRFTDNEWFDNTANMAINVGYYDENWSVLTQLAVPYDDPIRRFTIERVFNANNQYIVNLKVGRFPRVDTTFNSITDAPSSYGMAMLPLGQYSRRVSLNRAFNVIDGVGINYIYQNFNSGIFKLNGDYGLAPIDNQCKVQYELTRKSCDPAFDVVSQNGNYDLGASYEINTYKFSGSVGNIQFGFNVNPSMEEKPNDLAAQADTAKLKYIKLAALYSYQDWWFLSEITDINYLISKEQHAKTIQQWLTHYVLMGYNWRSDFNTYVSVSHGHSILGTNGKDVVVGATYISDNTTISLEHHQGNGHSWSKAFSTIDHWNSWVFSITQRF